MPIIYTGLLVSSRRNFENNASSEISYVLTKELEIEKENIKIKYSGIVGLIAVRIKNEAILDIMKKIINLESDKSYFMHCLKFKPIMYTTDSDLEKLAGIIHENKDLINGEYKIDVNKRHTKLRSKEVIEVIADKIDNKVNLENPQTVVLVEILGDKMGVSIIPSDLIYTTNKATEDTKKESKEDNWFL